MTDDNEQLPARAMSAWLKEFGPELAWIMEGEAAFRAVVLEHDGRRYVRLHESVSKTTVVYRVANSGQLRRMIRPPKEVRQL